MFWVQNNLFAITTSELYKKNCEKGLNVFVYYLPSQHGRAFFLFVTMTAVHLINKDRPRCVGLYYQHAKFHYNPFTNKHAMLL